MSAPRFTVFTPTFNAGEFINRPFESIRSQATRDFEWIVVDDASSDDTVARVRELCASLDAPSTVIVKPENRGVFDSFAQAVELARGEFFVLAAHDDTFDADTLAFFDQAWSGIPEAERERYYGITVLCRDAAGRIAQTFPSDGMDSDALEMYFQHRRREESWTIYRTAVLREFPFPRDRRTGEGAFVWFPMAKRYRARYFNRALRTYYRDNPRSITRAGYLTLHSRDLADYNRCMLDFAAAFPGLNAVEALGLAARYLRFSRHSRGEFFGALARLRGLQLAAGILSLPVAAAMLLRDAARHR